jgi:hypothetical protein
MCVCMYHTSACKFCADAHCWSYSFRVKKIAAWCQYKIHLNRFKTNSQHESWKRSDFQDFQKHTHRFKLLPNKFSTRILKMGFRCSDWIFQHTHIHIHSNCFKTNSHHKSGKRSDQIFKHTHTHTHTNLNCFNSRHKSAKWGHQCCSDWIFKKKVHTHKHTHTHMKMLWLDFQKHNYIHKSTAVFILF